MKKIARENLRNFIKETASKKIISVVFKKKDSSTRVMSLRVGVKKNLRGGQNKVEALDRPYLTVYDMNKKGYRTLNLHTVSRVTTGGVTYEVR